MTTQHNRSVSRAIILQAAKRPRFVFLLFFVAMLSAGWSARQVAIDSDFLSLIPANNPQARVFRQTLKEFGATDMLLIGLEIPSPDDLEATLAFADYMAEHLQDNKDIRWVVYRNQEFLQAALSLRSKATLFLSDSGLDDYLARFQPQALEKAAAELAEQVRSPLEMGLRELLVQDPLNLAPLWAGDARFQRLAGRTFHSSGYLIDPNTQYVLLLAKPKGAAADLPFSKTLMQTANSLYQSATESWREEGFESEPPNVLWGGGYPIAVAEGSLIMRDLLWGVLLAGFVIIGLFWYAFGRPTALLISGLPLFCGLLFTFGAVPFLTGTLNAATAAFGALLIGLSVDFIIVFYARYLEERGHDVSHNHALAQIGQHTYASILIGAVTTAATFFAFLISGFRGLSELGTLTGIGILIAVVVVALLLPALLTALEKNRNIVLKPLRAFGLEKLCVVALAHPKIIFFSGLALCLACLPLALQTKYDDNMLNMRSLNNPGLVAQNTLMAAFGTRFTPTLIRVDAVNETELINRTHTVLAQLAPLQEKGMISSIDTLMGFMPKPQDQQRIIQRLQTTTLNREAIVTTFNRALREQQLKPEAFQAGFAPFLDALEVSSPLKIESMKQSQLGPLLERYVATGRFGLSSLIYVYLPSNGGPNKIPPELAQAIKGQQGVMLTGPVIISQVLKDIVWTDARAAMLFGLILVLILLAQSLGKFLWGLAALLPLILGLVFTSAVMALMGLSLNFMNLFVFTMLIGIGVDYGLHFVHRWRETGEAPKALLGTSKAIAIAAITTLVGFGSLTLSHYPGLRSMGWVAIIGTVTTALLSLTFLPAMLKLIAPQDSTQEAQMPGLKNT